VGLRRPGVRLAVARVGLCGVGKAYLERVAREVVRRDAGLVEDHVAFECLCVWDVFYLVLGAALRRFLRW